MDKNSDDYAREELALKKEYDWLLSEEAGNVMRNIKDNIKAIIHLVQFNAEPEHQIKSEKYRMSNKKLVNKVKCMIRLQGCQITEVDLSLRLNSSQHVAQLYRINADSPWKLQQIQDTGNHLQSVLLLIEDEMENAEEKNDENPSGRRVNAAVRSMINSLIRAKESLMLPQRKSLEEVVTNCNMKSFNPPLPGDTALRFYVKTNKVVLSLYHKSNSSEHQTSHKVDHIVRFQLDAVVPWLNDVMVVINSCLLTCQLFQDKYDVKLLPPCSEDVKLLLATGRVFSI